MLHYQEFELKLVILKWLIEKVTWQTKNVLFYIFILLEGPSISSRSFEWPAWEGVGHAIVL